MRWLWMILGFSLLWAAPLWAGPLEDQLLQELREQGRSSFSEIEMALIASGAQTTDELAAYVARYQTLVNDLKLPDRLSQRPAKKKLKEVQKLLWGYLDNPDKDNTSLIDLIDNGTFSPLTATFLYLDILPSANLHPEEYRESGGNYESYFLAGREASKIEMVAALFLHRAIQYGKTQDQLAAQALNINHLLAPRSQYGVNRLDLKLYNQAYDLFQAQEFVKASRLSAAAAECFPARTEFHALNVNLGIQICNDVANLEGYPGVLELAELLLPQTGPHQVQLEERLREFRLEYAQKLYQAGQYEAAITQSETVAQSRSDDATTTVLVDSLEAMIQQLVQSDRMAEAEPFFVKLEALDPAKASQLRISHQVQELQEIYASGKMQEALAEASQAASEPAGKDRYLNLLSFYVKTRWDLGQYREGVNVLNRVPSTLRDESLVQKLRTDTYTNWMASLPEDDIENKKSIYRTVLTDRSLRLDAAKRREYQNAYGLILHEEIKLLIWDDKFADADVKSKEALAAVPNHAELLEQRQLLDTIMQRIQNE